MNDLYRWILQQPFLIGGVGTVLAGSAMYVLRAIPTNIGNFVHNSITSNLTVNSQNTDFGYIDAYLENHVIPWTFRNFEPSEKDDEEGGKAYLNTGYGSGWGRWKGVWFSFNKSIDNNKLNPLKTIKITFFTRKRLKIGNFVSEAVSFRRGIRTQRLYISSGAYWDRGPDKRPRELDTVFAQSGIIENIVEQVEQFRGSEDWYLKRGIPYKLAILLYGPPGTGKTSIIHAIASHFELDIMYVTALGTLKKLLELRTSRESVLVIEDIDTLAKLQRDNNDDEDDDETFMPNSTNPARFKRLIPKDPNTTSMLQEAPPLHDTLNCLDGFPSRHGSIIFITSNHPENLDEALLRDGRIDLMQKIGPLDWEAATRMYRAFFPEDDDWFSLKDQFQPIIGASLQAILMKPNPIEALRHKWLALRQVA
jgi:mitochondrial chaperone BCS1